MDHNKRSLEDANLTVTKSLPAAAANNDTDFIDLGDGRKPETVELEVSVPDLTALVEAKDITFTVHDSADASTSAAVASLAAQVVTGKTGDGLDAVRLRWKLPSDVRRYVRVNSAVETGGGDNTAKSITVKIFN